MKVGDLVMFKNSNKLGTIVGVEDRKYWIEVKVFHNVEGIQNPTGFTMRNLLEVAKVINESR